eukprot:5809706-Amphidinium_carterae.1
MDMSFTGWSKDDIMHELLIELRRVGVPYSSKARRGVLQQQTEVDRPRSCLLGLYTKMGLGLSTQTTREKWRKGLGLIHALAMHRPEGERDAYAAVMVNCNNEVSVHSDKANTGMSSLLSLGSHREGSLWVEDHEGQHQISHDGETLWGHVLNTHGHWQRFNGHQRHCILPAKAVEGSECAERFSITLFSPGRLHDVPEEHWRALQQLGFPVHGLQGKPEMDSQRE